jgi:uncharacterized protein
MRKIFFVLLAICFATSVQAATVHLKNGATVTGDIIERTAESVRVNVDGIKVTYYNDEIGSIDEGAAAVTADVPVADVPLIERTPIEPVSSASLEGMKKKDLILKFIIVFGTRDTMRANFEQMAASLPPEKGQAFRKAFNVDTVINLLIPVYDKYFSESDLKAYIEFYSSPAGMNLNKSLNLVMSESVDATMKYFELNMPPELQEQNADAAAQEAAQKAAFLDAAQKAGLPIEVPVPNK